MSKLIIMTSKELIDITINKCDGYILGLDNLSVNMPYYFNEEDLFNTIEYLLDNKKEVFVNLNKNMHTTDLEYLNKILLKLNSYDVKVMYYDISIPNLKRKLNLKYDLVWAQEHLTTNASTINFWNEYGAKYTLLSNEITKHEIEYIKSNTNSKLMMILFGYVPIFTSKRHLVDNYLKTFNIIKEDVNYTMFKEGRYYPVVDDKRGTTVYYNNIINGIKEYIDLDLDYTILNSYMIADTTFIKVLDIYSNTNKDNEIMNYELINNMIGNSDTLFLYKETVYKVK